MEFLYSITMYKCGVYNIPEKLQMITTFFTYYGTNLVFPVSLLGRLGVKAAEALPDIIGVIISWILNRTKEVVGWVSQNL